MLPSYLRGEVDGAPLVVSTYLRGLEWTEETVNTWAEVPTEGFWWVPGAEMNPIGGLVRHISGSSERLLCYALGQPLSDHLKGMVGNELKATREPPGQMLGEFAGTLERIREVLRKLQPAGLETVRLVGRKEVPVKAAFILAHLVEHANHHAGQIIVTHKLWNIRN